MGHRGTMYATLNSLGKKYKNGMYNRNNADREDEIKQPKSWKSYKTRKGQIWYSQVTLP